MDNLVISLLNGPNAPLIEAFFEGGKAPQELIKKHLSQVLHNYKHLEQKDTFLHLQDAFISEYSQFIAIPLIVQKSIHEKLKHAQICTLFFILVAKNDTKTVETFLKKSELSHLFGGPVFFVNQVLTMPLNESIDLPKEKRIEVMYKLLEHKLFTPFLLTACKTNRQTSKNFQEIALSAAQTQSNDRLTKIACNILCHEDMKEVLEDLQKKADGQFKDFIDLEIAKYKQKK